MLLADAVNTSADGKVNLLGEFSVIYASGFPAIHASMSLWIQLEVEPKDVGRTVTTDLRLIDPDGQLIISIERPFKMPAPPDTNIWRSGINLIIPIAGLTFSEPGDYAFTFEVNSEELGRAPVTIARIAPPPDE